VRILTAFSPERSSLQLKQMAELAGLDAATTLRYARTLDDAGFLCREADGRYSLGFGIIRLAGVRIAQLDVRSHAIPVMTAMRDEINETVSVNVRNGDYRVLIEQVEGLKQYRRTGGIGQQVPLHCGAASIVLMSGMSPEDLDRYLSSVPLRLLRDGSLVPKSRLRTQVQQVVIRGYAESENDLGEGGAGAAAPVHDHSGRVVAALNIAVPLHGWHEQRDRIIECVREGAARISRAMGYRSRELERPSPKVEAQERRKAN